MPIESIDTNLFEFYEYAASASGSALLRMEGCSCADFAPSPWAKAVFNLDFSAIGRVPAALIEGIKTGEIPNKVHVGPTSLPREIERCLVEAGFSPCKPSRGMNLEVKSRKRVQVPEGFLLSPCVFRSNLPGVPELSCHLFTSC